jgi:hypothetical protein
LVLWALAVAAVNKDNFSNMVSFGAECSGCHKKNSRQNSRASMKAYISSIVVG